MDQNVQVGNLVRFYFFETDQIFPDIFGKFINQSNYLKTDQNITLSLENVITKILFILKGVLQRCLEI